MQRASYEGQAPAKRKASALPHLTAPEAENIREAIERRITEANQDATREIESDAEAQEGWEILQEAGGLGATDEWEQLEETQRQTEQSTATLTIREARQPLPGGSKKDAKSKKATTHRSINSYFKHMG